jgi:hypothetical protein
MTKLNLNRFFLLPALAASLFLFGAGQAGAVTVFSEDFEGGGLGCGSPGLDVSYVATCDPVSDGAPFWEVTTGDNLSALSVGGAGNSVLGGAGADGTPGIPSGTAVIPWVAIDISSFMNLVFSVDIAATQFAGGDNWEAEDFVRVIYQIDGGAWIQPAQFDGPGNNLLDPDIGGGNPTSLTGSFQNFVFNIPNASTIRFGFVVGLTGTGEQAAFDNVLLQGDTTIPEPSTVFLFGAGLVGFALIQRKKRKN